MTFKTGKQNIVHLQKAEIAKLKEDIQAEQDREMAARFARELGDSIMLMLAQIPLERWPEVAKVALKHHQRRTPTSAYIYATLHKEGLQ